MALVLSLLVLIEDFSYLFGNLINFNFTFWFIQYHIVSNIVSLEPSIPTFCILCFSVEPQQTPFCYKIICWKAFQFIGSQCGEICCSFLSVRKAILPSTLQFDCCGCRNAHLSTILFDKSLESIGVDMPWIETMNLLNVSTLFAYKSSWRLGRVKRRSAWVLISTQFRNGNVTMWLKCAKHSSSVMKSPLDKYIL